MATTSTVGLLSSCSDHAMVLASMKTSSFPPPPTSSPPSSSSSSSSSSSLSFRPRKLASLTARRKRSISCEVAIKSDDSATSSSEAPAGEDETGGARIGARVRVTAPLKVYHVAKAPEIDICGMEGTLKQYVAVWKGKRISANLPFKVEFVTEVEGRGAVKFAAHLRDDEFEYV